MGEGVQEPVEITCVACTPHDKAKCHCVSIATTQNFPTTYCQVPAGREPPQPARAARAKAGDEAPRLRRAWAQRLSIELFREQGLTPALGLALARYSSSHNPLPPTATHPHAKQATPATHDQLYSPIVASPRRTPLNPASHNKLYSPIVAAPCSKHNKSTLQFNCGRSPTRSTPTMQPISNFTVQLWPYSTRNTPTCSPESTLRFNCGRSPHEARQPCSPKSTLQFNCGCPPHETHHRAAHNQLYNSIVAVPHTKRTYLAAHNQLYS